MVWRFSLSVSLSRLSSRLTPTYSDAGPLTPSLPHIQYGHNSSLHFSLSCWSQPPLVPTSFLLFGCTRQDQHPTYQNSTHFNSYKDTIKTIEKKTRDILLHPLEPSLHSASFPLTSGSQLNLYITSPGSSPPNHVKPACCKNHLDALAVTKLKPSHRGPLLFMMENQNHHSVFETSDAYPSQALHDLSLRHDWNPFSQSFEYAVNPATDPIAFNNFYQFPPACPSVPMNGQGQMAQLRDQTHPASHGRAYHPGPINMTARPVGNPIQQRKVRSSKNQTQGTGPSAAKRQKIAPPMALGHRRCASEVSQVSECCSSCPDTPPCDVSDCCSEPECDLQPVAVIPCYEQACEKPSCSDPCLSTSIQVTMPAIPTQARTSNWLDSQWMPPHSNLGSMQQVMTGAFDNYTSTSASPAPTTPSMSHHMDTPYSPNNTMPTPQYANFPTQLAYNNNGQLTSTTSTFPQSTWADMASGASTPMLTSCLWNGCQEQHFATEQQWISHLHNDHIDPQMSFGCPVQGESCPPSMNTNPLNHLQTDHGFNFEFGGNGFNCPAPACGPSQTFFTPTMFHNHFDQIHGVPAQGSIHCEWAACNTPFVDPQDLIAHLNQQHKLPVSIPFNHAHQHDKSLPTETASILASLPTAGLKRSASPTPATTPEIDPTVEFTAKGSIHQCKWNDGDAACGEICDSEESLQKHIKYSHLDQLDKASGYKCRWDGCSRDSRRGEAAGFTQRGKLERHMATHTGCKCTIH